jgi:hypothetical protein
LLSAATGNTKRKINYCAPVESEGLGLLPYTSSGALSVGYGLTCMAEILTPLHLPGIAKPILADATLEEHWTQNWKAHRFGR